MELFRVDQGQHNADFVNGYTERWGTTNAVSDPMEAAYLGVHFWAQAVAEVETVDLQAVRRAILGQKFNAPEGPDVRVDADNQHTWKYFRLGQVTPEGTFRIVLAHDSATPPIPYPKYRTHREWEKFQNDLYEKWGKRWSRQPV